VTRALSSKWDLDAHSGAVGDGIAELRGRTPGERAGALVAIVDPSFRAELERASERLA
jgi:acyl-CoA hydrolase